MGKLIIVENDKVEGTDKHSLSGSGTLVASGNPATYVGAGSFDYKGKMTDQLSDFVKVDGKPVALKSSKSSLNTGEDVAPAGNHSGPMVKDPLPSLTTPIAATVPMLKISGPVGTGNPGATAGSTFVKIASTAVLLDGDKMDTCGPPPMNSTVTSEKQDFVSCSAKVPLEDDQFERHDEMDTTGVSFPLRIDDLGQVASQTGNENIQVKIMEVLMTAFGERVHLPEFGCGLRDLVFDPNNDILAATTEFAINAALQRWLGNEILVESVDVAASADSEVTIEVVYSRRDQLERTKVKIAI